MRFLIHTTTASLLLAGAAVLAITPASAEDDIYFNHAKGTMSGSVPAAQADQGNNSVASNHHYMQMDPRDAKAASNIGQNVDASNPYFNHAEGTMTGSGGDATPAVAAVEQNGRYTATYHQYMQMDPRDAKPISGSGDVDRGNIYFNHAKGTMSGD